MVTKKDGTSYRMVIDYRLQTVKDPHPLSMVQDSLDKLYGCSFDFSTLDLSQSYHQLPLHAQKTAFTTQHGLFEFRCVSFGLCNAPSAFSRFMAHVLDGLPDVRLVNYLDDLIIGLSTGPTDTSVTVT
jgi:hypothetical protein